MRNWTTKEARVVLEWAREPDNERMHIDEIGAQLSRSTRAVQEFLRRVLPEGQRPWAERPRWGADEIAALQLDVGTVSTRSAAAIRQYVKRHQRTAATVCPDEDSERTALSVTVAARFSAVYTPLPAATEVHPSTRDVIDSSDAASQAAMKRSMAIDDIADRELAAADQMMTALASTAPGTAEMIGAQAGAWVVRSQAYTQQALAEMMRLRAIELAGQSAQMKDAARFAHETRDKLMQMNR
jgi:hypothetical protein